MQYVAVRVAVRVAVSQMCPSYVLQCDTVRSSVCGSASNVRTSRHDLTTVHSLSSLYMVYSTATLYS